jgi:hypothetical protein
MNTSVKTICNFNCICIDNDCKFSHFISIKDRKTTHRIYDTLDNINKNETNPEKRKANCRYGQLCNNPDCGFRHKLCYKDRCRLILGFNANVVLNATTSTRTEPKTIEPFNCSNKNPFECLEV